MVLNLIPAFCLSIINFEMIFCCNSEAWMYGYRPSSAPGSLAFNSLPSTGGSFKNDLRLQGCGKHKSGTQTPTSFTSSNLRHFLASKCLVTLCDASVPLAHHLFSWDMESAQAPKQTWKAEGVFSKWVSGQTLFCLDSFHFLSESLSPICVWKAKLLIIYCRECIFL